MVRSREQTRSTQSQICVKYRGIIIFIKRNYLKILQKNYLKKRRYLKFLQNFMRFAFNLMLDWRAMNVTVSLASRYQGPSLSAQCCQGLSSNNTLSGAHSYTAS